MYIFDTWQAEAEARHSYWVWYGRCSHQDGPLSRSGDGDDHGGRERQSLSNQHHVGRQAHGGDCSGHRRASKEHKYHREERQVSVGHVVQRVSREGGAVETTHECALSV